MNRIRKTCPFLAVVLGLSLGSLSSASAAGDARGFSVEKTAHGVTVKYNGELFTEYVTDQSNKSYLWPVIGPTGKPMTRAFPMLKDVKGEQTDHPHHRGIWFGHEKIGGFNTWADLGSWGYVKKEGEKEDFFKTLGTSKLRKFREVKAEGNNAVIVAENDINSPDGKKAMEEVQTLTFQVEENGTRVIDFDIDLIATEKPIVIADAKDAGFCIRVPTSMVIDQGQAATTLLGAKKDANGKRVVFPGAVDGRRIITSEGLTNDEAWGKRAKWVDYEGPVGGEILGIAMLNHPSSFRYPTPWHVRTYGLFGANPFGVHALDETQKDETFTLKKGDTLKLRHRIIFHKGDEKAADIAGEFEKYTKETK